jgi:hypothetical protein
MGHYWLDHSATDDCALTTAEAFFYSLKFGILRILIHKKQLHGLFTCSTRLLFYYFLNTSTVLVLS